jgi:xanthine dehydrogenase YagT iron-sulfur-binding subunit
MASDGKRDSPPEGGGLSRRDFLRGGAVAGALGGAGLLAGEMLEAAKQPPHAAHTEAGVDVWGPGQVPVRLRVNDKSYDLQLEPRTTLLDALRGELELTGAKRVCDRGTCGACTVILNGRTVYSCSVLAIDAQRLPIQTVEGIGRIEDLHPLQAAFVEHDAQQCGFCTPGFVMAAKALLDHTPNPSLDQVHHGLSGNFCRCGTYAGMRKAVLSAATVMAARGGEPEPDSEELKAPGTEPAAVAGGTAGQRHRDKRDKKKKKKKRGGGHG